MVEVIHHEFMRRLISKMMIQAIALAIVGDGTKRNQPVIEEQDDIRPLMTEDKSVARVELLGVFRMQTGTMLERTVNEHRYFPGQTFQGVQRFGKLLGLFLGEALERRDGNVGRGLQHLTALGFVQSRTMGGFCEGMFRRHHHQQESITGADSLQTLTDRETMCNPSRQDVSLHSASPP